MSVCRSASAQHALTLMPASAAGSGTAPPSLNDKSHPASAKMLAKVEVPTDAGGASAPFSVFSCRCARRKKSEIQRIDTVPISVVPSYASPEYRSGVGVWRSTYRTDRVGVVLNEPLKPIAGWL